MKNVLIATALCFAANSTFAGACDNSTDADIQLLEDAKTLFLAGEFQKFADDAGAYFPDLQANYDNYFGAMENDFRTVSTAVSPFFNGARPPDFIKSWCFTLKTV